MSLCVASVYTTVAQIGVNTEYPRTIFHIDGAGDNPRNTTTPLTAVQQSNDVVVDNNGKLGVNVIAPETKLHLENDPAVTSTASALRLTPAIGNPSILWLSTDGTTVQWKQNPSLGVMGIFEFTMQSFPYLETNWASLIKKGGMMDLETDGTPGSTDYYRIRIPSAGRYMVTINIIGINTSPSTLLAQSLYVMLGKNNNLAPAISFNTYYHLMGSNLADAIEYYQSTVSLYAGYCTPSDYLVIRLTPTIAYSGGTFTTMAANPITVTVYNI